MVLDALYMNRQFRVPDLGFTFSPSSVDVNEYITGVRGKGGVYVNKVVPLGIMGQAGVRVGDVLLAIDGYRVEDGDVYMPRLMTTLNVQAALTRKLIGSSLRVAVARAEDMSNPKAEASPTPQRG